MILGWLATGVILLAAAPVIWLALAATGAFSIPLQVLRRRYGATDSRFVTVDGVELHLRDSGHGPILLLIHGHFQTAKVWDRWAERLDDVRFIRLDMPPYGLSGPDPSGRYGPDRVLQLLETLVEQEDLRDIVIGGTSTGSAIALRYALAHPERVRRLVLINAPLVPVPPSMQPRYPLWVNLMETHISRRFHRPKLDFQLRLPKLFADPSRVTEPLIREHYDMFRKPRNARDLTTFTRSLAFTDQSYEQRIRDNAERLASVTIPTLILWGGAGSMLPVSLAEQLKAAMTCVDADLKSYEGAGHFLPLEAPQAADDLRAFVLEETRS